MESPRIWHMTSNRWNSAITEYALCTALALKERGHRESWFSPLRGSPSETRAKNLGLNPMSFESFSPQPRVLIKTLGLIKQLAPQIIIVYEGKEDFLVSCMKKLTGSSYSIVRFYGSGAMVEKRKLRFLSFLAPTCRVVPSRAMEKKIQALPGKSPIHRIPLGSLGKRFRSETQQERPFFLIFGRLDPVKGHREFMEVFALFLKGLSPQSPKPYLLILGQEANLTCADLETQARSLGLTPGEEIQIEKKFVEDPPSLLSRAILGVVPSLDSEWIVRVGQEFLLCGTPIFVSQVGSLEETLFCPEAGASFSQKWTPQSIADELSRFYDSLRLWDIPGARSALAQKAQTLFSIGKMGQAWDELSRNLPKIGGCASAPSTSKGPSHRAQTGPQGSTSAQN
jgi:glycosyltransferase involved in cell wall biosynthesis